MPVTLLTAPPPALTQDELSSLSSSTPHSFDGIPPLLRHHEQSGVRVRVDPPTQGFDGEGLEGGLWVTEDALSFFSPSASSGLSLPYTHLTLHAISRSPAPSSSSSSTASGLNGDAKGACIYCQFEEEENAEEQDDYDGTGSREMWITPADPESVDKIFSTLSYCASLHPTGPSASAPGVLSGSGSSGESSSHFNDPSAAMFASMGLDPSSMVFAGEDGTLQGPGVALFAQDGAEEGGEGGQFEDGEEGEQHEGGGRVRSGFVNEGRARGAPY
ncbi:hypothetical protein JCM10207_008258 [Rhodosporidiobolus poonsookiae]